MVTAAMCANITIKNLTRSTRRNGTLGHFDEAFNVGAAQLAGGAGLPFAGGVLGGKE